MKFVHIGRLEVSLSGVDAAIARRATGHLGGAIAERLGGDDGDRPQISRQPTGRELAAQIADRVVAELRPCLSGERRRDR
jgi:hypothetical protein